MANAKLLDNRISRKDMAQAGLKAFFNIAQAWNLTNEEQKKLLGIENDSTFYKWKSEKVGIPSKDQLERISLILGIYKSLQILFPNPKQADEWIKKPNDAPLFNGDSALTRMCGGSIIDLYLVRKYLDAQRGWG